MGDWWGEGAEGRWGGARLLDLNEVGVRGGRFPLGDRDRDTCYGYGVGGGRGGFLPVRGTGREGKGEGKGREWYRGEDCGAIECTGDGNLV